MKYLIKPTVDLQITVEARDGAIMHRQLVTVVARAERYLKWQMTRLEHKMARMYPEWHRITIERAEGT